MKFTVITVTYNSSKTLRDTFESVLLQTCKDYEYIVIDGDSIDGTINLIKEYETKFEGRMHWISEKDMGIYDAMNKGIKMATGDIIGFLNSDDLYTSNDVIESIVQIFKTKSPDCVHANLYYVRQNNTNQIIRHWKTCNYKPGSFSKGWHPAHPTFIVKKEIYERYGIFDMNFKLAADFELMLRFIERYNIKSEYINKPLVRMRLGGATSKNIQNIIKQNIECYRAFKVNEINVSPLYPLFRLLPKIKQYFNE